LLPTPIAMMPSATAGSLEKEPGGRFAELRDAVGTAQAQGVTRFGFELVGPDGTVVDPVAPGASESNGASLEPTLSGTPPPATEDATSMPPEPASRAEIRRTARAEMESLGKASLWARDVLEQPVTTFVGRQAGRFNDLMAEGEAALHRGEYMTASSYFTQASAYDVSDPLPYLARGHAMIAAGNYVSAVAMLTRGIDRFPQIAAFKLDLPSLVGQRDIFDIRRADLETRLESGDDAGLRFLLGYLELYSGLPDLGLPNLEAAATMAEPGSVIARFPGLVTGREPIPPAPGENSGPQTSK
jgi:hypothetical protein